MTWKDQPPSGMDPQMPQPPQAYPPRQDQSTAWPPQPAVWPPPAQTAAVYPPQGPLLPARFVYKRLKGPLHDLRDQILISVDPNGIVMQGKAQVRQEIQQPILVVFLLLFWPGLIIASLLMRYAFTFPVMVPIRWEAIRQITLVPNRNWAGFVFDAPNYNGVIKTFTLVLGLDAAGYTYLTQCAEQYRPGLAQPGKLKPGTSIVIWILLWLVLGLITAGVILSLTSPHS